MDHFRALYEEKKSLLNHQDTDMYQRNYLGLCTLDAEAQLVFFLFYYYYIGTPSRDALHNYVVLKGNNHLKCNRHTLYQYTLDCELMLLVIFDLLSYQLLFTYQKIFIICWRFQSYRFIISYQTISLWWWNDNKYNLVPWFNSHFHDEFKFFAILKEFLYWHLKKNCAFLWK